MSEKKYIRVEDLQSADIGLNGKFYLTASQTKALQEAHVKLTTYTSAEIMAGMWVPSTERLPEPSVNVLALYGDGRIDIDWLDNDGDFRYADLFDGVTHWMPLPQPPKEAQP